MVIVAQKKRVSSFRSQLDGESLQRPRSQSVAGHLQDRFLARPSRIKAP